MAKSGSARLAKVLRYASRGLDCAGRGWGRGGAAPWPLYPSPPPPLSRHPQTTTTPSSAHLDDLVQFQADQAWSTHTQGAAVRERGVGLERACALWHAPLDPPPPPARTRGHGSGGSNRRNDATGNQLGLRAATQARACEAWGGGCKREAAGWAAQRVPAACPLLGWHSCVHACWPGPR